MLDAHEVAGEIKGSQYLSLRSQVVRAAMSVPANIVEGRAQRTDREFSRFLGYAIASASELEYHLIAACDIGVLPTQKATGLIGRVVEVRKMLIGLQKKLSGPA